MEESKEIPHHKQQELCTTRPPYRQGRKLTAVKVYTASSESQHLYIYGVPGINLRTELKSLCMKYGNIVNLHVAAEVKSEAFTETYHIHFEKIQSARIAKRMLDNKSFYGGFLHVCYAPERETINETRLKLEQRRLDVTRRLNGDFYTSPQPNPKATYKPPDRKRKRPAIEVNEERMQSLDPNEIWKDIPKELDPRLPKNLVSDNRKHYQIKPVVYGPFLQSDETPILDNIEIRQETNFGKLIPQSVIKIHKKQKAYGKIIFKN